MRRWWERSAAPEGFHACSTAMRRGVALTSSSHQMEAIRAFSFRLRRMTCAWILRQPAPLHFFLGLLGYFLPCNPRAHELVLRRLKPKDVRDGVVLPTAFEHRPSDTSLSWSLRRGVLADDSAIESYLTSFVLEKSHTIPGLCQVVYRSIFRPRLGPKHFVFLLSDPAPMRGANGRIDPYARLHMSSRLLDDEERVRFARLAQDGLIATARKLPRGGSGGVGAV